MKLVTWNCRGAFHRKYQYLEELKPDIAVVQECASPERLKALAPRFSYASCVWHGDVRYKGLSVFTFGDSIATIDARWDRRFHIFLPVQINGSHPINLLAVWAFNGRSKTAVVNSRDTREAILHYGTFLTERESVVAGDFNASVIWDRPTGKKRFRDVDAELRTLGLESGYHATTCSKLGSEAVNTHFHTSRADFHIDYIYHPQRWAAHCVTDVGERKLWSQISDHAPLELDLSAAVR